MSADPHLKLTMGILEPVSRHYPPGMHALLARQTETAATTTETDPYAVTTGLQQLGFFIIFFFPFLAFFILCLRLYSRVKTATFGLGKFHMCCNSQCPLLLLPLQFQVPGITGHRAIVR